ncbi:MAG: response regulator [Rubrivivax sp.]|nr:response regulator [Rubrivivax sp.]
MKPQPRHVLVVDDNEIVRTVMQIALEDAGYRVHQAADGRMACAWLDGHRPVSCVVCDLSMPHADGHAVLEHLRSTPAYQGVPALVVSTDTRAETRAAVRQEGARAYISKPCNPGDLVAAVNRLCA